MSTIPNSQRIFTVRNAVALIFALGFFIVIAVYVFVDSIDIPEILLGAMIVQITLIVQFYFRRSKPQWNIQIVHVFATKKIQK